MFFGESCTIDEYLNRFDVCQAHGLDDESSDCCNNLEQLTEKKIGRHFVEVICTCWTTTVRFKVLVSFWKKVIRIKKKEKDACLRKMTSNGNKER